MNSQEIYEELSSGRWLPTLVYRMRYVFREEAHAELLASSAAVHFQEMFAAYHEALAQEASEREAERVRVTEDIEANPQNIEHYRRNGWSVTKRAKKVLDLDGFLDDHGQDIPKDALSIVKTRLPKWLKKELTKYETIQGHTYSAKRYQTDDEV